MFFLIQHLYLINKINYSLNIISYMHKNNNYKNQIKITVLDKTTKDFHKKYDVFLVSADKTVFQYKDSAIKSVNTIINKVC